TKRSCMKRERERDGEKGDLMSPFKVPTTTPGTAFIFLSLEGLAAEKGSSDLSGKHLFKENPLFREDQFKTL
ncbi:hypothetical protein HAX54_028324, partial [Datura stramonium]|nr:hypothetical protein [Datura stramonium]